MPGDPVIHRFDDRIGYAAGFVSSLLDPRREPPPFVSGPNGKAAKRRYNVYRNNVTVSLIDALAATYPATLRITGSDFFRTMARFHVRATPPTSPLLFEYGREFPTFIERYEHARQMPWLADVARIELAWLDSYHATDAEPLAREALASIAAERLPGVVLTPHPATRIVRSRYPAVTIFAENRNVGLVNQIKASGPEDALITRPGLEVTVRRLPPGGAVFLANQMEGGSLGSAAAAALSESPEFDLAANIAGMLGSGTFAALNDGGKNDGGKDHDLS